VRGDARGGVPVAMLTFACRSEPGAHAAAAYFK